MTKFKDITTMLFCGLYVGLRDKSYDELRMELNCKTGTSESYDELNNVLEHKLISYD